MKRIFTIANEESDEKVELECSLEKIEDFINLQVMNKRTGTRKTICSISEETGKMILWPLDEMPGLTTDNSGYIELCVGGSGEIAIK